MSLSRLWHRVAFKSCMAPQTTASSGYRRAVVQLPAASTRLRSSEGRPRPPHPHHHHPPPPLSVDTRLGHSMVSLFALLFLSMRARRPRYSCERTHFQTNWGVCRYPRHSRGRSYCARTTWSCAPLVRGERERACEWKATQIRNVLALSKCLCLYPSASPFALSSAQPVLRRGCICYMLRQTDGIRQEEEKKVTKVRKIPGRGWGTEESLTLGFTYLCLWLKILIIKFHPHHHFPESSLPRLHLWGRVQMQNSSKWLDLQSY